MTYEKKPTLLPLPRSPKSVSGLFWRPNSAFIDELIGALQGKRVLEIFAGNGYLAAVLASRGIDVVATSILSGIDAHDHGIYYPIEKMDAVTAVQTYGHECDILLMSWPTTTKFAVNAAELWGDRPIVFIGEFTDYSKNQLGGCATDEFFERFAITNEFASYKGNMLEKACIGKLLPVSPEKETSHPRFVC